jgi:hypothetical protein
LIKNNISYFTRHRKGGEGYCIEGERDGERKWPQNKLKGGRGIERSKYGEGEGRVRG